MHKILVVEDEKEINEMISESLSNESFLVMSAYDGKIGLDFLSNNSYSLVILDLMMPEVNGLDFINCMRKNKNTPILVVSAKNSDLDKALALSMGADDYITKPFSVIELVARVRALIRRHTDYSSVGVGDKSPIIDIGELKIDLESLMVKKNGIIIRLTPKELELLKVFALSPKKVFTKAQLYELIWKENFYRDDQVINAHILRLRNKIEDNPSRPKYIKTIWGIGYRLGDF